MTCGGRCGVCARFRRNRQSIRAGSIKGLEAIIVESYTLARRHGVEHQLLDWVAALSKRGVFRELSAESGWRDYADKIIAVLEKNPGALALKRFGRT